MQLPQLEDLPPVDGKRVLVRTDFNVPLDGDGRIVDDFRIRAALPTLQWLQEHGATVVACSHLGRPKGAPNPKYSMAPVRARLAELAPGVELLENLRFDAGEEGERSRPSSPGSSRAWTPTSTTPSGPATGPMRRSSVRRATLPSAAGRLLAKEVEVLLGLRDHPKRPFVAVLGGAKVSDKIGVIDALLGVVDSLVIGGGMCFTFLGAQGFPVGDSLFEPDQVDTCRRLLEAGKPIHLPDDIVGLAADGSVQTFGRRLPDGAKGLDIGPGTAAALRRHRHRGEQRLLERPDGHVRGRALRSRHQGRRPGRGRHPRLHRGGGR